MPHVKLAENCITIHKTSVTCCNTSYTATSLLRWIIKKTWLAPEDTVFARISNLSALANSQVVQTFAFFISKEGN